MEGKTIGKRVARLLLILAMGMLAVSTAFAEFNFDDTFSTFNTNIWVKDGVWCNGGVFMNCWDPSQIWTANNLLYNQLEAVSGSSGTTYNSGEMRTTETYGFGRYDAWMLPVWHSGTISAFFTYTGSPHDEIDIEFLGRNPYIVGLTFYVAGTACANGCHPDDIVPPDQTSGKVSSIYSATNGEIYLGFDPTGSTGFHEYSIDWYSDHINWLVDDVIVATAHVGATDPNGNAISSMPSHWGYVMSNLWNTNCCSDWAGTWDPTNLPVQMLLQEVKATTHN